MNVYDTSYYNSIPIKVYTVDGYFVDRFDSAVSAAKALSIERSAITGCISGKYITASDNIFIRDDDNGFPIEFYMNCLRCGTILQFKDGIKINSFKSLYRIIKVTKIPIKDIYDCLIGKISEAGGYVWKFSKPENIITKFVRSADTDIPISVYTIDNKYIDTYASISEVSRVFNIDINKVSKCVAGIIHSINSYIFVRKDKKYVIDGKVVRMKGRRVEQYKDGKLIRTYANVKEASRISGVNINIIYHCLTGSTKESKGYTWKYLDYGHK